MSGTPPPRGGPRPDSPYGYGPPQHPSPHDPYAPRPVLGGPGRRLVARIIDLILAGIIATLLALPITGVEADDPTSGQAAAESLVGVLVFFAYDGVQNQLWARTLGKRALRLRVARVSDGAPPTPGAAWGRAGVFALPPVVTCVGPLFWIVDVSWLLWDRPWEQCLHDKAAHTTVVRTD